MTDRTDEDTSAFGVTDSELDGHTLDQLWDYLDAGETPPDPSIDESPGCQIALDGMRRLRALSWQALEEEAEAEPEPTETWVRQVLSNIGLEARAGRDIPYRDDDEVTITEGALRGIVRAAGDRVPGVVVGRVRLEGEVQVTDAPIRAVVEVTAIYGAVVPDLARLAREAIVSAVREQTDVNLTAVDVVVGDVQLPMRRTARGGGER